VKRTRPFPLLALALAGAILGFLLQIGLASGGRPILVPPVTLPITLAAAGALVLAFAIPVYRAIRGPVRREVNPFRAMRVVVLAKASSLVGSLVAGFGLGCTLYVLSRAIVPEVSSLWLSIASAAGGVVLLVAGLVSEQLCALPPDDFTPEA
jgi:hypothetical protein